MRIFKKKFAVEMKKLKEIIFGKGENGKIIYGSNAD